MNAADREVVLEIANRVETIASEALAALFPKMEHVSVGSNEPLIRAGQPNEYEYFVLHGILRTFVVGSEGDEVTLGFYLGPCILSPSITRSDGGISQVDCYALAQTDVVTFPYAALVELMQKDTKVQRWGDTVLRNDLVRRSRREWALAAMSGSERLGEFRKAFPNLEATIAHHMIASYLGVTPVTLSRLRKKHA